MEYAVLPLKYKQTMERFERGRPRSLADLLTARCTQGPDLLTPMSDQDRISPYLLCFSLSPQP